MATRILYKKRIGEISAGSLSRAWKLTNRQWTICHVKATVLLWTLAKELLEILAGG
jgi:hypothetical protein